MRASGLFKSRLSQSLPQGVSGAIVIDDKEPKFPRPNSRQNGPDLRVPSKEAALPRGTSSQRMARELRAPSKEAAPVEAQRDSSSELGKADAGWASQSLSSLDFPGGLHTLKRNSRVLGAPVTTEHNVLTRPRGSRSGLVVQHSTTWTPVARAQSASGAHPATARLAMSAKFSSQPAERQYFSEGSEAPRPQTSFFKRKPLAASRRVRPTTSDKDSPREAGGGLAGFKDIKVTHKRPDSSSKVQRGQPQDVRAPLLATKFRLKLNEVKNILEEFDKIAKMSMPGENFEETTMTAGQFKGFLCRVFEVSCVPDEVAQNAYEGCLGENGVVTVEGFLQWYTIHMFTVVNLLNADLSQAAGNELIYTLAKKHEVSTMTIDKIKSKFDMYDSDGSGEIEYEEFKHLFIILLKVKHARDLSQDRAMRAWKEIDDDRSGGVDFAEFTEWYLKYLWTPDEDQTVRGPAEAFYDSFNPTVQRHQVLEKTMNQDYPDILGGPHQWPREREQVVNEHHHVV